MGCCCSSNAVLQTTTVAKIDLVTGEISQESVTHNQTSTDAQPGDDEAAAKDGKVWFKDLGEHLAIGTKVVVAGRNNTLFGAVILAVQPVPQQQRGGLLGTIPAYNQYSLATVNSDGRGFFVQHTTVIVYDKEKRPVDLDELPLRPLDGASEDVVQLLNRRGALFRDAAIGHSYLEHSGEALCVQQNSSSNMHMHGQAEDVRTRFTTGRAVIDIGAFNKEFPQWSLFRNTTGQHHVGFYGHRAVGQVAARQTAPTLADGLLFLCHPRLPAFSFEMKAWGLCSVDNFAPVQWQDEAWEMLVMPEEKKKMICALTQQVPAVLLERSRVKNVRSASDDEGDGESKEPDAADAVRPAAPANATDTTLADEKGAMPVVMGVQSDFTDIVVGKGGGCVFLLHGKPGVGKTLTAEAVAELLHMPLYSVSMAELSTNPAQLELQLKSLLANAAKWGAVVLLDEADIFLERRQANQIQRCALVGIFLRLLEYHSGILFLTTNRVKEFDPAFHSRINLCVAYPDLDIEARSQIWRNMLQSAGCSPALLEAPVIAKFAARPFNGRQIRNCVRLALALRKEQQAKLLAEEHVAHVIGVMVASDDALRAQLHPAGTGGDAAEA